MGLGNGRERAGPGLFNAATYTHVRCTYKNGVVLECMTGSPAVRCIFEGPEGLIRVDNRGQNFVTIPEKIRLAQEDLRDVKVYPSNDDHQRNFLDCVKSRDEPAAPVEVGHRSGTLCHLGNIAIKLQSSLKWNPKKESFVKNDEANRLLTRAMRTPWQV